MEPQPVNNSKLILTIATTALITALVVGGGVFVWQRSVIEQEILSAVSRIQKNIPSENDSSNFQTYRDEQYGYEIKYPRDWAPKYSVIGGESVLSAKGFSIKGAGAPISIVIYKNEKNLSLQEYFDVKNNTSGGLLMDPRAVEYTFFKELKPVNVNVANTASLKFETPDYNITVIPNSNKIYEILYVKGSNSQTQTDSKVFADILSTFKFTLPQTSVDTSNWKTYNSRSDNILIFSTDDWSTYSPKNNGQSFSFSIKYPGDWKYYGYVFDDAQGNKIAEFSPGPIALKAGQKCFDAKEEQEDSRFEILSQMNITIGGMQGALRIEKSMYEDVENRKAGYWYPNTYCLMDGEKAFAMSFYEKELNSSNRDSFKKIISTLRFE